MWDKIKWFWRYYRHFGYVLGVLILLTPVQAALQVTIPRLIEFTIDYIKTGVVETNRAAIWLNQIGRSLGLSTPATFALALVAIGLTSVILYAFVQSHRAWMNYRMEWFFRQDAFNRLTSKGPDFFNRFRTGDLITRLTDDVEQKLAWFSCSGIFRLYEALLIVTFAVAMMITIDPMLTLFSAGPLPLLIFIFFKSSSHLDKRYDHLQKKISSFNDIMEACFTGIRVVKAYVKEGAQRSKFDNAIQERRTAEISAIKAATVVDSLYMYIWQFGVIIVLLTGGYMVIHSNLSLGKLVAFIYYVIYLVFPMFDIGQFLVKSRQSAVSIDRLMELENVKPMVTQEDANGEQQQIAGNLQYQNVSFSFPASDRRIINDISLEIKAGSRIAFVGKVGMGKTWLVNMLPRLVDPTEGQILLDGRDLRSYELGHLRQSIGYVPQEPILFSDTVKNNVLFGRDDISQDLIEWALEVSQLKEEIGAFPKGIDTPIGTRGMSISGGQKQRLALARALVGKPKILVLDDCTSALDSNTEAALWERLHEVLPGMTTLIISHRPDTLERTDYIYVLEDGKIIESGRHTELLEKNGQYARMYTRYRLEEQVTYGK